MMGPMRLLDVSHVVTDGMTTYPGLPGPRITDHLTWEASHATYAPGTEFRIGRIEMVANTGTYLDTPAHRHRDGWDLADLPLQKVAMVPLTLVDAAGPAIDATAFDGHELAGRAVVVRTGWSRHWGTEAYGAGGHPHLTAGAARALVDAGARLVGIDSINIDGTATGERPAHTILLGAGIPIVEHLCNLDAVPDAPGATFTAVPVKVAGMATFPVRAFVAVPGD